MAISKDNAKVVNMLYKAGVKLDEQRDWQLIVYSICKRGKKSVFEELLQNDKEKILMIRDWMVCQYYRYLL